MAMTEAMAAQSVQEPNPKPKPKFFGAVREGKSLRIPQNRRQLVSRKQLITALSDLPPNPEPELWRSQSIAILKPFLLEGRAEVARRFDNGKGDDGLTCARANAYLLDQLMRVIFDHCRQHQSELHRVGNAAPRLLLSLVAVGGYGRGELAPFSDIDLLFLLPNRITAAEKEFAEAIVQAILYLLWDLGLKVGHSVRSVETSIEQSLADMTIRTALLEARWLWGEVKNFQELLQQFQKKIINRSRTEFATAKLSERDRRVEKMGDSRYVLEPNLKDGKGGLRDLQTIMWIARFIYSVKTVDDLAVMGIFNANECRQFHQVENFLWTLRFHLHLAAGRAEERLTFDVQTQLASAMRYKDHAGLRGVERFMKHYFLIARSVGNLLRVFCANLAPDHKNRRSRVSYLSQKKIANTGFKIVQDKIALIDETKGFVDHPRRLIQIFALAGENGLEIHPATLRLVTRSLLLVDRELRQDLEANRYFLDSLSSTVAPDLTLRRMNEAGLLGRFIPDFGRVVAQMQYDMYHVYTVDEHTLFALSILHRIEQGLLADELPLATTILPTLQSRRALFVAVFLHDIAKGRKGDHSILGEEVALRLGPRLGLDAEEVETVAWLVRHHLDMSNTAFRRDLQDPKTISDFAAVVQSPERLKLLLVLTAVDIRAVGPKVWNNWKAVLLRQIYALTMEKLVVSGAGGEELIPTAQRLDSVRAALRSHLADWQDEQFERFWSLGNAGYFFSFDPLVLAKQARLVKQREDEQAPLALLTQVDSARGVTEVTICTDDHPGLFSEIAGALAVSGANIVDARIFTLSNGVVLDGFSLQDAAGGVFDRADKLARLSVILEQALSGKLRGMSELRQQQSGPNRAAVFTVRPRVLIDNLASATYTVVEVNGRDRPGLLHDICSVLTRLNLQIGSAKIATFGERAVDVFYIKNIFGLKIDSETVIAQIRAELLEALG
ncbi:MAG: [protein-PII] uridylyltransferase [Candidatus Pacebacteria bacterium]|nr:[protein-PII] uridylyltransferase [Candidatus Paceibacterota bacterium]